MQFDGAVVTEQNVTFAIAIVRPHVLQSADREQARRQFSAALGIPAILTVLMAQDARGIPTYNGRPDIVQFLAGIDFRRIPWRRYTMA